MSNHLTKKGTSPKGLCMWGKIYSEEKCKICGESFNHDENRRGLFCKNHQDQEATGHFIVRFGSKVTRRESTYQDAENLLNGLRWEVSQGKFDANDYRGDAPNGFTTLANKYVLAKEQQGLKAISNIRNYMKQACKYFGQKNLKTIKRPDIRDFLFSIPNISDKTRYNYMTCLQNFFNDLYADEVIAITDVPRMPKIDFELGYRKIVDLETQNEIVEKVREIADPINPKIAFGIDMLAHYTNIRPGDLLNVKESDIDIVNGAMTIWRPTKKKGKFKKVTVRLIDKHIDFIKNMKDKYPALPDVYFFRHIADIARVKAVRGFGNNYLYTYWKKACAELGIKDVDLYGGTRHSTVTALAKEAGEKAAKKASGHDTNAAFYRYCQYQDDDVFDVVQIVAKLKGTIVDFEKKKSST